MSRVPTVLNYWRPDGRLEASDGEIVPLLWPGYAWRVIAPRLRDSGLNLFQRAVLGACRAARLTPEALAAKLGLHVRLVAVVLGELARLDLVDAETGAPTEKGVAALMEDDVLWDGADAGWVFQDGWSDRLFPFFTTEGLLFAEGDRGGSLGMRINIGRRKLEAYMLEAAAGPVLPQSDALHRALRQHRRREKIRRHMDDEWSVASSQSAKLNFGDALEVVDEVPEPVLLLTVGRMARDTAEATIDDLFGFGEAPDIWIELQRVAAQEHSVARLRECVDAIRRTARATRDATMVGIRGELRREVERDILQKFSPAIRQAESVFDHLVSMRVDLEDAKNEPGNPWHRWDNAKNNARKVLEALLKEMERRDPLIDGLPEMLPDRDADCREVLNARAQSLGFKVPLPVEIKVSSRDRERFRERWEPNRPYNSQLGLVGLLLRACQLPAHRLHAVAKLEPRFFDLVIRLRRQGNMGSHDNENGEPSSFETTAKEVEQMSLDCYRVVSLLLDLPVLEDGPAAAARHG